MNDTIKAALITGIFSIIAALIGNHYGKQDAIIKVNSQVESEITGNLSINSVSKLISEYNKLVVEYDTLRKQIEKIKNENSQINEETNQINEETNQINEETNQINEETNQLNDKISQLNNEISQLNDEIDRLETEINKFPSIEFEDMKLSIEGTDMAINSSDSSAVINNRTYYADDFIYKITGPDTDVLIQDGTMYINPISSAEVSLLDQWVVNENNVHVKQSAVDSYGNTHSKCLYFYRGGYIVYNLNEEYSLLKFKLSISKDALPNVKNTLTIKADDRVVYTSPELTRTTKPFDEIDIHIDNCSLLRIESDYVGADYCILSDVEVYN